MGRATAIALLAVGVVLTGLALALPLYSSSYPGGVEVVVNAWGTTVVNRPGDWPPGDLSPMHGIPFVVTAALLLVPRPIVALAGAFAQLGALGILLALAVSDSGRVETFELGAGLVLLAVGTAAALTGAVFRR